MVFSKNFGFLKPVFLLLTVLWLGFIFGHSLQSAAVSTQESDSVAGFFSVLLFWLPKEEVLAATTLIRKGAHLLEFAVLGGLLAADAAVCSTLSRSWSAVLLAGMLAALTDETIQLFVPGRSSEVRDVWIDTAGVLLGLLAVLLLRFFWNRRKQRKHET